MKRITLKVIMYSGVMLFVLFFCVSSLQAKRKENGFKIKYKGVTIMPGDDASVLIKKTSNAKNISKYPSCLTDGYDYTYEYPGFVLSTYTLDKNNNTIQFISSIELKSKKIKTSEGLKIGDNEKKIIKKYKKIKKKYGTYTMTRGKTKIVISTKRKKIKGILICKK